MTPAQITRLAHVRSESAAGGTRLTVRELTNGHVRITERERGQKPLVVVMGLDGHYL